MSSVSVAFWTGNVHTCQRMSAYVQRPLRMTSVCQRMPACLKRVQPMPYLPLAYVSEYQRMSGNFIRNSVTGPLLNFALGVHVRPFENR